MPGPFQGTSTADSARTVGFPPREQGKVHVQHVQHVLTAIAVIIERLGGLSPAEEARTPRRPTAFQNHLDQREIPGPKSWRTLGS
ncbi:hypothetical protein [Streptomyces sp. RP5T]|uniref:hypothetical protein n=1 Tax=Streptomyces sp. RP5T TaxID=2490848 RepID=UPI00163A9C30|nr:hypothetical protein [Streptomyces sp. RP5T]